MRLSISNIAWTEEQDEVVYSMMKKYGFAGLEVAPTRIFPKLPYEKLVQASAWADEIKERFGFVIPSMQSIWFGRQEKLFGTKEERAVLLAYTKKAIDFATAIGCRNLVFGCPRNRSILENADPEIGVCFFREIGNYAASKGTVIGLEANPPIYNTNYINDTRTAVDLIKTVNSKGFLLNLDVGTMVQNEETIDELYGKVQCINHVHISEPGLKVVEKRKIHRQLRNVLDIEGYKGFVSIEMGKTNNFQNIENSMAYVKEIFE